MSVLFTCGCGKEVAPRHLKNHQRSVAHGIWAAGGDPSKAFTPARETPDLNDGAQKSNAAGSAPNGHEGGANDGLNPELGEKLRVRGRIRGEEPPDDAAYAAELARQNEADAHAQRLFAATGGAAGQDLNARELGVISSEELAQRAIMRASGAGEGAVDEPLDGRRGITGAEPFGQWPEHGSSQQAREYEAAPPWGEAYTPPGFTREGKQIGDPIAKALAKDDSTVEVQRGDASTAFGNHVGERVHARLGVAVHVDVDASQQGRELRVRRARETNSAKPPSVLEQMLGVHPANTRPDWAFEEWTDRNPDGHRWRFTRFYGIVPGACGVLEDRFDPISQRDLHEIQGKIASIRRHNERKPQEAVGYLVLHGSVVRPTHEAVEAAMRGEAVVDLELPNPNAAQRVRPGVIYEASSTIAEQLDSYQPMTMLDRSNPNVPVEGADYKPRPPVPETPRQRARNPAEGWPDPHAPRQEPAAAAT